MLPVGKIVYVSVGYRLSFVSPDAHSNIFSRQHVAYTTKFAVVIVFAASAADISITGGPVAAHVQVNRAWLSLVRASLAHTNCLISLLEAPVMDVTVVGGKTSYWGRYIVLRYTILVEASLATLALGPGYRAAVVEVGICARSLFTVSRLAELRRDALAIVCG